MWFWRAYISVGVVADLAADRMGWPTLSSTSRHDLHTDTRVGRVGFLLGNTALSAWLPGHILTKEKT